jgi:hypothetical protein
MSRFVSSIVGSLALVLTVGACEASSSGAPTSDSTEPGAAAAAAQATPLTASGAAEPLPLAADTDGSLRSAAVGGDTVAENGARLFGIGGDDNVAGNSLYAYIAFPTGSGSDWAFYELGNIIAYTVLSSSAGRVDLDIEESTSINEQTGELFSGHRKVIVSWTPGTDGAVPTNVTITPAQ